MFVSNYDIRISARMDMGVGSRQIGGASVWGTTLTIMTTHLRLLVLVLRFHSSTAGTLHERGKLGLSWVMRRGWVCLLVYSTPRSGKGRSSEEP